MFNLFTGTLFSSTHYPCRTLILFGRAVTQGVITPMLAEELQGDYGPLLRWRHRRQAQALAARDAAARPDSVVETDELFQEGVVTTDICGSANAHALRLDAEAVESMRREGRHRKVATAIFFESHGRGVNPQATLPEIRPAVAAPDVEIGSVEQALEALADACYFLSVEQNRYQFNIWPNLNKLIADRRAGISAAAIDERVRAAVQKVFQPGTGIARIYFPTRSGQIPDRPALTLVVAGPDLPLQDGTVPQALGAMVREAGTGARTFKSALIWSVPRDPTRLTDAARKALAWEAVRDEEDTLQLSDTQRRQLPASLERARHELREAVWQAYNQLVLLDKDNALQVVDLGLIHSSAAGSLVELILSRLQGDGTLTAVVGPAFLVRELVPT